MEQGSPHQAEQSSTEPPQIVSVNARGGTSGNLGGKIFFVVLVVAVVTIGGLIITNKWRAANEAQSVQSAEQAKIENRPAQVGIPRTFNTDPPVQDAIAGAAAKPSESDCGDGTPGQVLVGPDGRAMSGQAGPMRVCKDGRVLVPGVVGQDVAPIGMAGGPQTNQSTPPPSRYGGDVIVPAPSSATGTASQMQSNGTNPYGQLAAMQQALQGAGAASMPASSSSSDDSANNSQPSPTFASGASQPNSSDQQGSIGALLQSSKTPMVSASRFEDQNFLLPQGRTIECGLSLRIVTDVSGMATCVLSSNVYSDNGKVLLLEKGSEATGEYVATMAQGQRRLFVLWSRIKTYNGIFINLDSPAADELGTSGLPGYVDNRWAERIGAAFLLSLVQDAVAIETADRQDDSGGVSVYQNSTRTTDQMAQRVLESTINIKPTLYKNQGDLGTISVARDLDFSSVYALRAK